MVFKGRTVFFFVLLAIFASSLVTVTIVNSMQSSVMVDSQDKSSAPSTASDSGSLSSKDMNKLAKIYQLINSKFYSKVDKDKVIGGAIDGMVAALEDPFTVYMDQAEAKSFEENVDSSFTGVGAEVSLEDGKVTVISPMKGSPSEKAGIRPKDVILSVNGEKLDGLKLSDAVMKIRGPKGTQAKLEVLRAGSTAPIEIIVVRDDIDIETVFSEMLDGSIGKIEIRQFSQNTATRFNVELKSLESKGMKALIIDVRNDPGGILPVVLDIAQHFVPDGKNLVQVEDRDGNKVPTLSKGPGKNYPVTVLINKGSASASEILAAALQQTAGSKLIGETSYGKGTVQSTFDRELGDGSNIKITIAKWLTPNGTWIHKKGIAPDMAVQQPAYFRVNPISVNPQLKPDTTGDDIKNLQIMLDGLGYKPDRTDGYYSVKTVAAVEEFEKAHQLPVNDTVDEKTASAIEKAIVEKIKDPKNDLQLIAAEDYLRNMIQK